MQDVYHIDKARVRKSFARAAQHYDAAAILQKIVRDEMMSRLDLVTIQPKVILDAGCGTGLASHALARKYANANVIALDFALPMLQKSRRVSLLNRLQYWLSGASQTLLCADMENLPITKMSTDFIWSNLAMQWCDLDSVLSEFHRILKPEGLLIFSTFGPDTLHELRQATDTAHGHNSVSRFIDMHDIGDALIRAGFSAPVLDVERYTLTYDNIKRVMQDLKSIGAHNATDGRARGLSGKGFFNALEQAYEAFRRNGKLPATFEVVYAHAWKGQTPAQDGVSPIQFHPRRL